MKKVQLGEFKVKHGESNTAVRVICCSFPKWNGECKDCFLTQINLVLHICGRIEQLVFTNILIIPSKVDPSISIPVWIVSVQITAVSPPVKCLQKQ